MLLPALVLNFAWEMLQMPLFASMDLNWQTTLFCALASVADAIMVLLLYFGFALIYKDPFWAKQLTWQRVVILVIVGGIGAIISEIRHLGAGNWTYSNAMLSFLLLMQGFHRYYSSWLCQ